MTTSKGLIALSAILAITTITAPAWSSTARSVMVESSIFKKVVDVRDGIKNKQGQVVIKDDLRVKGNLIVDNEATVDDGLTVTDTIIADNTTGVQIDAADVILDTSDATDDSYLESATLQDALDDELAIDLSTVLPNSTWTITNLTNDLTYDGYTGQVTFTDTTLTVDSGRFAAADLVDATVTSCSAPSTDISYQVVAPNLLYVAWESYGVQRSAVLSVFATDKDSFSVVGNSPTIASCGQSALQRISTLTKVSL